MLYEYQKLDDEIVSMRKMAIMLVPYSHPKVSDDYDVNYLKQRETVVDGYTITISLSRSDYEGVYLDVVSFTGKYMPYLPMPILCKLGERFLGNKELTFNEVTKDGRKYYSWMVLFKADGTPISNSFVQNGIEDSFNGLEFTRCGAKETMQVPPV
jgi:hypothetical protein